MNVAPKFNQAQAMAAHRCGTCKAITRLRDLNDDMLCEVCGGPSEDPEFVLDQSDAVMLREHGTWSI